jgi:hypothetical protein
MVLWNMKFTHLKRVCKSKPGEIYDLIGKEFFFGYKVFWLVDLGYYDVF